MKQYTSPRSKYPTGKFSLAVTVLIAIVIGSITPARAQYSFTNAGVLTGTYGSVTSTNIGAFNQTGAPNIDGFAPFAPIWYQWKAPQDGVVAVDTIGSAYYLSTSNSVSTNIFSAINTVLGVYTGTNVTSLSQVAANDNLFPLSTLTSAQGAVAVQFNESGNADYLQSGQGPNYGYEAPFYGPSGLRFNAVGGQTYYFAVDSEGLFIGSKVLTPSLSLTWAYEPSGVFRFASEDVDPHTGMLLYQEAQTESVLPQGTDNSGNSTILSYYGYNAPGALVTVTRTAGSTGRVTVNYSTIDGTNLPASLVASNDAPAFAGIDYSPVSGTLVFDDFEMSKTILIPINDFRGATDQTNLVFEVQLSNAAYDPYESGNLAPPRVDPVFGTALVRILNVNADPYGPDQIAMTNSMGATNFVNALFPTNVIFNFEKAHYRVPADVDDPSVSPWPKVTLWVERFGTNTSATTLNYRVNNFLGSDQEAGEEQNILFPLQPGSDYAVPTPQTIGVVRGTNSDFVMTEGTISFPGSGPGFAFQPITFTVPITTMTKFNKDFKVQIYHEVTINNQTVPQLVGMVNEATVTILFNDLNPPAGSVDELYNADFNSQLALYSANIPVTDPADDPNPGVGINGEVYATALLTNNEALIGGNFASYNGFAQSDVALIATNGMLDTSFKIGSGANAAVYAVGIDGNQFYVGGGFTSFNGSLVGQGGGVMRLNADGSVDNTFFPGTGPNGAVRAMAVLPNGEVLIGGDFTQINGAPHNFLALMNTSGGVDPSFNPSNNITGPVYALALQGSQVMVGGSFGVSGEGYTDIARLNLDGSIDTTFKPVSGADNVVHTLAWTPGGQILAGGEFTHFNGLAMNRLVELNNDGSLNTTNFFIGSGADNTVFCINYNSSLTSNINTGIVSTNSEIYVGGAFSTINGTHRLGYARLYANGLVDTTFLDTGYNQYAGLKKIYSYDNPAVFTTAVQSDGNVLIGGSFNQVGGGQATTNVCNTLDDEEFITESFSDPNLWVEPKTRDGVRNRTGWARLIGGSSAGPGNLGFYYSNYSVNKSQSALNNVLMLRTNGNLGPVGANFSVQSGTALNGQDFSFYGAPPIDWVDADFLVEASRERSDGLAGSSDFLVDPYGRSLSSSDSLINKLSVVNISIIANKNHPGNLNAQVQLANPSLADTFYLGGEEIPVAAALGLGSAPLAIVDDTSAPGVFGFSSPTFVATNLSAVINVVRSNGIFGNVSMRYSTTNITALAGTDYVGLTNQFLQFNDGITTNGFTVTIKNNGSITNVEKTLKLSLFNLGITPGATFGISNAVLRIINPSYQGFVTLGATNYVGAISSGVLNFTVNRIVGSQGTITVQYATTNGSAMSGTDYLGVTNTLTWGNGDVSPRIVSVPLLNPGLVGTNRQFSVSLANPTLNSVSTPSLLSGSIIAANLVISNDNNYGTVQFSQPSYTVNEIGGYATLTVVRTGGEVGTVSVNYATANGANTASPANYLTTNGVLVLGPNQTAASFTVPIVNDGVVDPTNFYFNAVLSNATNAALGSIATAKVNILDAQSFNQPPGSSDTAFLSGGFNGEVLSLSLQPNGQILAAGNFTAAGGTPEGSIARLNSDGTLDTAFLSGLAGANAAVNSVVCQTDSRVLVGGTFSTLDGDARSFIGRLMTDGSLDTSFNPGSGADGPVYALAETFVGGNREIYAGGAFGNMNGVSSPGLARLNNNGTFDTTFSPGSGFDGQIYAIAAYPTNSIFAGKVLVGGLFNHYNGVAVTNLACLNIDGSLNTNFANTLGSGPNATVRALALQSDGSVILGGDFTNVSQTVLNRVARLTATGSIDPSFTTNLGLGADDSVQGIVLQPDNRIVLVGQFTRASGVTRNHITRLLPTGAIDPSINFGDGANGDVAAVLIQPANGFLVIGGSFSQYDDQTANNIARLYGNSETGSGQFEFTAPNYQVDEAGLNAQITVRRTGGTSGTNASGTGDVFVNFATTNGTAVAGTNYLAVSQTIDFPAGEVLKTVQVPVLDDHVITPNLTVGLVLSSPTPPAGLGNQPTATLTLIEDDSAISFSSPYYSQNKNTPLGVAEIDIIRQGGTNLPASVGFFTFTNGNSAVPVRDFYPTSSIVVFNPGQADVQVQVPIVNNGLVEGNTTVGLALTNVVNSVLVSPSNAVLTIIDTTPSPGRLAFTATNYVVNQSDGTAFLTVIRTNGTTGAVSASYNTVAGTAQPGVNYSTSSGSVSFANGQTSGMIAIPLLTNSLVEPPVTFSVDLSNPTGGALLIAPSNSSVTILSENVGVTFLNATNYVGETNGFGNIIVERVGKTNTAFQVNYFTTNGTALAGTNYQAGSGTLSFISGQLFENIQIPLINNQDTSNLMFGIVLANPTAGAVLVAPSNTVVVVQPGLAGLSFTSPTNTVAKNGIHAVIPVVCSNPSIEPVPTTNIVALTVHYATADGTAQAGLDYVATNGTLTFLNGLVTNYITVPIINNSLTEGNRTFSINLSNPTFPGKVAPLSTQLMTILDDNSGLSFSSRAYSILKTGGQATITVLRTDFTNSVTTVNFATADGTGKAGQDYLSTNGTLVFTNGQTALTFGVPIIGSSPVQPDKTVLLQLSNPNNGFLISPYAATLTIRDNSGSLVVAAGSTLVSESYVPPNGIIDPGETVSLLFAFRASGGTNITDLQAALVAGNGVVAPSGPQDYGALTVGGPSASRVFSFTASGTNGQSITASFLLTNGVSSIGSASFAYVLGTVSKTFYNTNPIIINPDTIASPYPSFITVSNVGGDIIKATVTLTNMTESSPQSVDVLVVSPSQQDTLIMANAGGQNTIQGVTLNFDDSTTNGTYIYPYLPNVDPSDQIISGTNRSSGFLPVPTFP